ncbi:MAG: glutaredoxin [Candidatus Marinimicrobia bacterium]|nr:glutaredoxin [Candidatus Neomarinimicrobiota bacterium]|tara:strand:+ start:375 stop:620 length:246 start_codon:yes stop_codon:yes gene_type:complete
MIKIYSTTWCGPCASAKRLLDELGQTYEEIDIEEKGISRQDLQEITGGSTVPQIIINGKPIGGFDSLLKMKQDGTLKEMLK